MGEPHVVSALRDKRAELSGLILDLEKRIGQTRADLVYVDAVLRLFGETEPAVIAPKKPAPARSEPRRDSRRPHFLRALVGFRGDDERHQATSASIKALSSAFPRLRAL
jgi:hypothetical protein